MAIVRINKTRNYTVMSNTHFKEKQMSLKAKGLLSLMLSLPDDWDYSIAGLVVLSKDGKDSVMNALSELEDFGYLIRTKLTNEKGQFAGYNYDIFEYPQSDKPNEGEPYAGKPNTVNPPQLNTNTSNTKISNTKKERKKDSFNKIIIEYAKTIDVNIRAEVTDLLIEWLKVRKAKRAAMTDRAIQMNIDKLDNLAKESNLSVVEYLKEVICRGWAAFYAIQNYNTYNKEDKTKKENSDFKLGGTHL